MSPNVDEHVHVLVSDSIAPAERLPPNASARTLGSVPRGVVIRAAVRAARLGVDAEDPRPGGERGESPAHI